MARWMSTWLARQVFGSIHVTTNMKNNPEITILHQHVSIWEAECAARRCHHAERKATCGQYLALACPAVPTWSGSP